MAENSPYQDRCFRHYQGTSQPVNCLFLLEEENTPYNKTPHTYAVLGKNHTTFITMYG